jgi:hypothetical protein
MEGENADSHEQGDQHQLKQVHAFGGSVPLRIYVLAT